MDSRDQHQPTLVSFFSVSFPSDDEIIVRIQLFCRRREEIQSNNEPCVFHTHTHTLQRATTERESGREQVWVERLAGAD